MDISLIYFLQILARMGSRLVEHVKYKVEIIFVLYILSLIVAQPGQNI
jgi:hypothetical protein